MKKNRTLYLLKILNESSCEKQPLTLNKIIELLAVHGFDACGKTIVSDIAQLVEYDIDVVCYRR